MEKYKLIIADPPWRYKDQGTRMSPSYQGKQRNQKRYDTMSLEEICAFGEWVKWIADSDSILMLWCTPPLRETHPWPVIKEWGFEYKTSIPWTKARWDEKKKRFVYNIAGGHYARACSEDLYICTRGSGNKLIVDHGVPGAIIAPASRVHSRKPSEQYDIAEKLIGAKGPFLEMFARRIRPGWNAWGDEVSSWWSNLRDEVAA